MVRSRLLPTLAAGAAVLALAACSTGGGAADEPASGEAAESADTGGEITGTVTFRLWDEQAADVYQEALPEFEAQHEGLEVQIEVIPWADYWTTLRNDIAGNDAPDVFWTNSNNFSAYADADRLVNIDEVFPESERQGWLKVAVDQFTHQGTLWGVPAITDPGIGIFYNKELLDEAGVSEDEIPELEWNPSADSDSLRETAAKLTKDSNGNTPNDADFDPQRMTQFGYNAALDIQAIYLNYLGSNGAEYQDSEGMLNFDTEKGVEAFQYIVDLINEYHVSPSAADTNDNGDFSRDQFLQGNMALFQTGAYNLANIQEGADFEWGLTHLPKGPEGRISITNSIVAAGSADSTNRAAQKALMEWLAGPDAQRALGEAGVALPANTEVQDTWEQYWADQGIDVTPLVEELQEGAINAPFGNNIQGGMEASQNVLKEVFLGRMEVPVGVAQAQEDGNAQMQE